MFIHTYTMRRSQKIKCSPGQPQEPDTKRSQQTSSCEPLRDTKTLQENSLTTRELTAAPDEVTIVDDCCSDSTAGVFASVSTFTLLLLLRWMMKCPNGCNMTKQLEYRSKLFDHSHIPAPNTSYTTPTNDKLLTWEICRIKRFSTCGQFWPDPFPAFRRPCGNGRSPCWNCCALFSWKHHFVCNIFPQNKATTQSTYLPKVIPTSLSFDYHLYSRWKILFYSTNTGIFTKSDIPFAIFLEMAGCAVFWLWRPPSGGQSASTRISTYAHKLQLRPANALRAA